MSAPLNFDPQIGIINLRQLIAFTFEFQKEPIAKKIQEIIKERQKRQGESINDIICDVAEANRCLSIDYKRTGRRKLLWGLYETEPQEKLSISIRGHFC